MMKLLSSSSSSSSAASTTITTTTTAIAATCSLARVLRRLLCFNTLPTQRKTINIATYLETGENDDGASKGNPGIVARLMGLENLPQRPRRNDFDFGTDTKEETASNSVPGRKSSSMNHNFFYTKEREWLEQEEFIVITFKNDGESKECRSKARRRRRRTRRRRSEDRENLDPNKSLRQKVSLIDKSCRKLIHERQVEEECNGNPKFSKESRTRDCKKIINSKQRKEKEEENIIITRPGAAAAAAAEKDKVDSEHTHSENSSPVSVLDLLDKDILLLPRVAAKTEQGSSWLTTSNSTRKLSLELENCEMQSPPQILKAHGISVCDDYQILDFFESTEKDCGRQILNFAQQWTSKMQAEEAGDMIIAGSSNLVYNNSSQLWKLEHLKDIGAEYELHIFQWLLDDLVHQLIELYCTSNS